MIERRRARPRPKQIPVARTRAERKRECIEAGCALLVRVSSPYQAKNSHGSLKHQRAQRKQVKKHGGDPEKVRVYEALGQSADRGKKRPDAEMLTEQVLKGEIRTIILGWTNRIARAWDAPIEKLFNALIEARGAVIAQGRFYDVTDFDDLHRLKQQIAEAERQNSERAEMSASARLGQAHALELLLPLPTGLVWAPPSDPDFRTEMEREGLTDCLQPDALEKHDTEVTHGGRAALVFPDPRQSVWKAIEFLGDALLRRGSIAGALEEVVSASGSEYPRPGFLPTTKKSVYQPENIIWRSIAAPADGRAEWATGRVRDTFHSPALYGIYSYESPAMAMKPALLDEDKGADVWELGAFPGLFPLEAYAKITDIVKDPSRRRIRLAPLDRPRTNVVHRLHCGHPMPGGKPCGLAVTASHPSHRDTHVYVNAACGQRGHASTYPAVIDDTIVALLVDRFQRDRVEQDLEFDIESDHGLDAEKRLLEEKIRGLQADVDFARKRARIAASEGDTESEAQWLEDRRRDVHDKREAERQLRQVEYQMSRVEPVSATEREQILELANDFPQLLHRARTHDDLAPVLTTPLVEDVLVRRLGAGQYWVEILFPTGARASRLHRGITPSSTAAMRATAAVALEDHLDPSVRASFNRDQACVEAAAALAQEWNEAMAETIAAGECPLWDAERVLGVAYDFDSEADLCALEDEQHTLSDWADELNVAETELLRRALAGELGRPSRDEEGSLRWAIRDADFAPLPVVKEALTRGASAGDLVEAEEVCAAIGLNPRLFIARAEEASLFVQHEDGSSWVLQSESSEWLTEQRVDDLRGGGDWMTFAEAEVALPGVTRKPLERAAIAPRPRRDRRMRLFWIDDEVRAALRNETVAEALERFGDPEGECRPLPEARRHFSEAAGFKLTATMVLYAMEKGRIIGFRAGEQPYSAIRRWLVIPKPLWEGPTEAGIRVWLKAGEVE